MHLKWSQISFPPPQISELFLAFFLPPSHGIKAGGLRLVFFFAKRVWPFLQRPAHNNTTAFVMEVRPEGGVGNLIRAKRRRWRNQEIQ